MAEFYIAPDKLKAPADELSACRVLLKEYRAELSSVRFIIKKSLGICFKARNTLADISDKLSEEAESCTSLSTGLNRIVQVYERSEKHVCEYAVNGKSEISWEDIITNGDIDTSNGDKDGSKGYGINDIIQDYLKAKENAYYKEIIAATGPFGIIVDGIKQFTEGEYGKGISDILKFAGGLVKNTKGTKVDWASWFGFNPSTKGPWESALGKYTDFSSARSGFSTVCNWATAIITSGYDNMKEFGDGWWQNGRFYGETITETLINVGEGILIGTAAAAILGTSAPAVAVAALAAAGTVAVDYGINSIIRMVTGDPKADWKEAVSDFVCNTVGDAIEWVKDNGAEVVDWAIDTGQAAVDWAVDTAKDVVNNIGEGISNIGNSICSWFSFA